MLKHFKMDFKILKFYHDYKTDASLIHRYRPSRRGAPLPSNTHGNESGEAPNSGTSYLVYQVVKVRIRSVRYVSLLRTK